MANLIKLPRTQKEFMSSAGKEAIARAEMVLNAIQDTQLIIVDAAGKEKRGVLEFSESGAVLRIKL